MKIRSHMWIWMFLILLLCQEALALPIKEKNEIIKEEWIKQQDHLKVNKKALDNIKEEKSNLVESTNNLPNEFSEKISIKNSELPMSESLKTICEIAGCHVIFGSGVENKKISIDLENVTIEKALNSMLFQLGYDFKFKDNDLVILAFETKVYRIILPPLQQGFNELTSNESSMETSKNSNGSNNSNISNNTQQIKLGTKILVSNESEHISLWDDVVDNLKSLLSKEGKFSINKSAGIVIVTDTPINLQRVTEYFKDLDRRVSQQIEVDVKVVEVSLNKENHFGIDWNALADNLKTLNSFGVISSFAAPNFTSGSLFRISASGPKNDSGYNSSGISAVIDALSKQGEVEIVSQPRVRILNNQVAVIQVGSTQSFVDSTSVQVTQTGTITSISTSQVQEGVTMRLLANIVGDEIYLSVAPVITTIDKIRTINSGNTTIEAPQTTTKSINTLVKVKEGESVAIGGLITSSHQQDKQSVPVISKIPLLGKLFQYSQDIKNKTELVIIITPKRG